MKFRITLFLFCFLISGFCFQAVARAACFSPAGPVRARAQLLKRLCRAGIVVLFLLALFDPSAGQAACFNPAGQAGDLNYNGAYDVLQFCNGGSWEKTGGAGNTQIGLVGWWKLDDGAGTSAVDSSGNGDTGALQNTPTWTTGMNNGALTFNGTNQYVIVPDVASLELAGSWTVAAWVNFNALPTSGHYEEIVGKSGSSGGSNYEIDLENDSGNITWYADFDSAGTSYATYVPTAAVTTGTWYHVVGTWNSSTNNVQLYVNGALVATENTGAYTPPTGSGYNLDIASANGFNFLNGTIDDVRVYNRPLSASDIKTLYDSTGGTSGDIQTGLIHYWKMDDGSGTTAVDAIEGANATLTGTVSFTSAGKVNGGLSLANDATNHYAGIASSPADLEGKSALTMAAWFKWTPGKELQIGHEQAGSDFLDFGPVGGSSLFFEISQTGTDHGGSISTYPTDGLWHHVTMVYDGTQATNATKLKGYVDGVAQTLTNIAGTIPTTTPTTTPPFQIGNVDGNPSVGTIDEVRIYNRALAPADVLTLYNTYATACAGPVGYTGDSLYNSAYHVPQFCNGTNWIPVGKVPGTGGGGCSSPAGGEGDIRYTSTSRVTQYCDGATWRAMGNVPITGLVGWWNLDEGSGTSAADSSGNGNTGALVATPTWTASGKINGALTFNGSTQWVNIPDVPSLRIAGSWTVSTWVKFPSAPGGPSLVYKTDGSGNENYALTITGGTGWQTGFATAGGVNEWVTYTPGGGISLNTWYLVTGIWDSSANNLYLYLNGVLVGTLNTGGNVPTSGAGQKLVIANNGVNYGSPLAGTLDDVRLYNRALSASEVWRLYNGAP